MLTQGTPYPAAQVGNSLAARAGHGDVGDTRHADRCSTGSSHSAALKTGQGLPVSLYVPPPPPQHPHFQPARSNTFCASTVFLASSPIGNASGLKVPIATSVGLAATLPLTTGHSLLPSAK
jgi:hypothetical protein